MDFLDRALTCSDCGNEFVFTAGEQLFFFDKQFKNDPKRCKPCKARRQEQVVLRPGSSTNSPPVFRTETRTHCSACRVETTVPFKPTQGRPVLCRECFQKRQAVIADPERQKATEQMNIATAELIAQASVSDHMPSAPLELVAAAAAI